MKTICSALLGILLLTSAAANACEVEGTGYSVRLEAVPGLRQFRLSLLDGDELVQSAIATETLTIAGGIFTAPGMRYVSDAFHGDSFQSAVVSGACR